MLSNLLEACVLPRQNEGLQGSFKAIQDMLKLLVFDCGRLGTHYSTRNCYTMPRWVDKITDNLCPATAAAYPDHSTSNLDNYCRMGPFPYV
jgi:hypothetical protein